MSEWSTLLGNAPSAAAAIVMAVYFINYIAKRDAAHERDASAREERCHEHHKTRAEACHALQQQSLAVQRDSNERMRETAVAMAELKQALRDFNGNGKPVNPGGGV